jgi:hypothetical protein
MRTQIIQDHNGLPTGVFIPMEDWENIKKSYPDIEEISNDIPDWQKEIISERLESMAKNPKRIKPIQGLFDALDKKVKR